MRFFSYWIASVVLVCFLFTFSLSNKSYAKSDVGGGDPWEQVPKPPSPVNHAHLFDNREFPDGPSVTTACLECHKDAARQVMKTSHWTWTGEPEKVPGHDQPIRIGKKNLINNFCISIESNWPRCTVCHAGYGWEDANFDFTVEKNVDCLICHDRSGTYAKTLSGWPDKEVDLKAVAGSVGRPGRDNCGWCHFNGGGGNAVKHGDLDGSLSKPVERIDIHMGRANFQCVDCHWTHEHQISGGMMSVGTTKPQDLKCENCHGATPHDIQRLNEHTEAIACQTCHIPEMALKEPTKVAWDWSTAGQDVNTKDKHLYLKEKGSFIYSRNVQPVYRWYNGTSDRYLKGDPVDSSGITYINKPRGSLEDPTSKIWPFKIHRGKQPYDKIYNYLLIIKAYGKGGFWSEYNWDQALKLGSQESGLPFSGEMGFTVTEMFYELNHMIASRDRVLNCTDCHGPAGRMNWDALGYDGDPLYTGGRQHMRRVGSGQEVLP